ncbi:MAG: ATP-binding protein [Myxococcota bacterium]
MAEDFTRTPPWEPQLHEERGQRARTFTRTIFGLTLISVSPQRFALPFYTPADRAVLLVLLSTAAVFNAISILLVRYDRFDTAGFVIAFSMMSTFTLISWSEHDVFSVLGWLFPLTILIPSNVLKPSNTSKVWLLSLAALVVSSIPFLDALGYSQKGLIFLSIMCTTLIISGYLITSYSYAYDRTVHRLEQAHTQASHASMAKSSFLANISHELRTPLNAIMGYAELLIEDIEGGDGEAKPLGEEHLEDVQHILGSSVHLLALINDILDLSKVEAGRLTLEVREVDLDTLLDEVRATAEPLWTAQGNTFVLDVPEDLGSVRTDSLRLKQVLLNLLSNAAKFTSAGTITLQAQRLSDGFEFTVQDTGVGLSEEAIARVFDAFEQADTSTSRRFGGTGLGLTLCKQLCRHLGGDIVVESALGQGATFSFTITDYA